MRAAPISHTQSIPGSPWVGEKHTESVIRVSYPLVRTTPAFSTLGEWNMPSQRIFSSPFLGLKHTVGALSIHRSSPSRSGRGKVKQTKWMKGHEGGGGGGVWGG